MRTCTKCGLPKPLTEFAFKAKGRRHYRCKACVRANRNELYRNVCASTKQCSVCRQIKDRSEFPVKDAATGKLCGKCLSCQCITSANYYARHRDKILLQTAQKHQGLQEIARRAKAVPCADCGVPYPYYVMDFDHRPGTRKVRDVSGMGRGFMSKAKLLEEIAKCDVVCANCHRERTYRRSVSAA